MPVFIIKIIILGALHFVWLLTSLASGYVCYPSYIDIGNTQALLFFNLLLNIAFYQIYVYLTYYICKLRKKIYNIIYWTLNFVGLVAELWFSILVLVS